MALASLLYTDGSLRPIPPEKAVDIWKDIPDFEGFYEVSNMGRVRSQWKILTPKLEAGGYLSVHISKQGKPKRLKIHRAVALAFIPNPDNKPQINHKDNNPANNELSNLEWCTSLENNQYKVSMGRAAKGEKIFTCKLNPAAVIEIREKWGNGISRRQIAREYGLGLSQVGRIIRKESWGYLDV